MIFLDGCPAGNLSGPDRVYPDRMSVLQETSPLRASLPRHHLGELAKRVPTLHATDSLAKALRQFGAAGLPALPVVENGALMGMLYESDVLEWMVAQNDGVLDFVPADACFDAMVMAVMRTRNDVGLSLETLDEVLPLFERGGNMILPVVDDEDQFLGVITRQVVLTAVSHNLRPAVIGGMATPLGVYLTTGHLTAGVGFWGLFLTGAALTFVSYAIGLGFYYGQLATGIALPAPVEAIASLTIFLVILRLSPLAGYHAAEHQTVNAIERGEPLHAEAVSAMPREHPRCGTNLMALLFGAQLLLPLLAEEPLWLLPSIALLFLTWRKVGGFLQRLFTTKPARRYQLLSGIRAGEELLRAYADRPSYRASRLKRFWHMGLVQILSGALVALGVLELAYYLLPTLRGLI